MEFASSQESWFIRHWVNENVLNHIFRETSAKTLWNMLEEIYVRKTGNNKLFLMKQMVNLKYKYETPMENH